MFLVSVCHCLAHLSVLRRVHTHNKLASWDNKGSVTWLAILSAEAQGHTVCRSSHGLCLPLDTLRREVGNTCDLLSTATLSVLAQEKGNLQ